MLTLIKKAGVAILISDKADFEVRKVIRNKEGHYIMIRGSILQKDIMIFHVYAPNKSVKLCEAKPQNCKEKYMSPLI